MGDSVIKSGANNPSYGMKVDKKNRAHVSSDSKPSVDSAIEDGRYFGVNSGYVTLTTDSPSSIMYIKNDSKTPFRLKVFRLAVGPSTNGVGAVKLFLPLNSTGGTLISGGTAAGVINLNLGSGNLFNGSALVGAEGSTLTGSPGGNLLLVPVDNSISTLYEVDTEAVIPQGFNAGITITPPPGNTSMEVQLLLTGYYIDEETL